MYNSKRVRRAVLRELYQYKGTYETIKHEMNYQPFPDGLNLLYKYKGQLEGALPCASLLD